MKRFVSFLLALMMLLSLAACSEGGLSFKPGGNESNEDKTEKESDSLIYPDDEGVAMGYTGDTLRTAFFDMTINDPYTCSEFDGLTPDSGYKFLVAELTLYNHTNYTQPMFDTDFEVLWDLDDDDAWDWPVYSEAKAEDGSTEYYTLSDKQIPVEFDLGIHKSYTGILLYQVPEESKDYFITFRENFDNGTEEGEWGDSFYVRFSE